MKKWILIIALGAAFAGCKVGKNYQGATATVNDKYRFADTTAQPDPLLVNTDTLGDSGAEELNWFNLFGDPVLDTLIRSSLAYNQDVRIAAEAILQAQNGLVVQRSAMLPSIGAEVGASRGNFQGQLLPEEQSLFYGALFANWELDFWGKYRRLNEAARAGILEREAGYRAVQLSLITAVATNYFQLLDFQARLEISRRNLAIRDSILNIIEQRFDKGIVAEIDVNQAEIKRAIAAQAVPLYERLVAQTEHLLSQLAGRTPQAILTGSKLTQQDTAISIPPGLPSDLLLRRPDVAAAEQQLIAQNAVVGAAQANRLPSISLTGLFGLASDDLTNLNQAPIGWNVGGSLLAPIFNFNRLKRQVDIEQSKRTQVELAYERTVLSALRSVEDALVEIQTLRVELEARRAHREAALNAQRLSSERYDRGVTSYLELLESQRQAFESELNYVSTNRQLLQAYVKLYAALGGGW